MTDERRTPRHERAGVCIANIGRRERRKRWRFGAVLCVGGAVLGVFLIGMDVNRLWRLLAFLPFWAGAMGILQAREKT